MKFKNEILRNSLFNSGSYLVSVVIAFAATPLFIYKLGAEGYGVYILVTSLIGYYNLLDIGLNQGVTKFVAEFKELNDYEAINRSINVAISIQVLIGAVASVLLIVFANSIINILQIDQQYVQQARLSIYACSAGFLLSMMSGTLNAALTGLFRYDLTAKIESSVNVVMNLTLLAAVIGNFKLSSLIYINVFFAAVSLAVYYRVIKSHFGFFKLQFFLDAGYFKLIFKFSSYLMLSKASGIFSNYIVRFIVSYFLGPAAVTLYVVPSKLLAAFGGLLSSASNVVFPLASRLGVSDSSKAKYLLFKASKMFAAVSIPGMLFIFIFSRQIMGLWMGDTFASNSYMILSVLTLSSLFASQTTMPNLVISGLGFSKLVGLFGVLAIICYCIFLPAGAKHFGVLGTSVGMLLTTLVNIGFVFYFVAKKLDINMKEYFSEAFNFHIIPVLAGFLIFWFNYYTNFRISTMIAGGVLLGIYMLLLVGKGVFPIKLFSRNNPAGK